MLGDDPDASEGTLTMIGDSAISASRVTRRLALATAADHPSIQPDDAHLAATLTRLGIEPISCVWNDPAVDWSAFDAVLIRTIWDYFKHPAAFATWLDRLDRLGVPTINDSRLLRWNSNKRYLFDLADHGVAIIPTRLTPGTDLASVLVSMPAQQVVIKPTVSGGAWQTLRGRVGDAAFAQEVTMLPAGLDYLVQPFVPEIVDAGEWSLLYFSGKFSHGVLKRPAPGDYRVQSEHGGTTVAAEPDAATMVAADKALAAVGAVGYAEPAYARVDGVICDGRFLLMELELIEPFFFLAEQPRSAERFAQQLVSQIDKLQASSPTENPTCCHDDEVC